MLQINMNDKYQISRNQRRTYEEERSDTKTGFLIIGGLIIVGSFLVMYEKSLHNNVNASNDDTNRLERVIHGK